MHRVLVVCSRTPATMTDAPKQAAPYPITNMTTLTDAQLRQAITQLSNAANTQYQHYASPAPQNTPAAKGEHAQLVPHWLLFVSSCSQLCPLPLTPPCIVGLSISQKCAHVVHFDYSKGGRAWSASWCESCCGRASPCRLRSSSCVSTSATCRSSSSSRTAATAQPTQASTTSCTSSHALHLCLTTPNRRNASRTAYPQRDHDHCTGINTSRRDGQLHRTRLW